jgi:branched-chain amino acid transport system substrate-binding protein
MTAEPRSMPAGATTPHLSRRTLLKRAAALGFSGSALAAFLGACGTVTTITEVAPTAKATAVSGSGAAPTAAAVATQAATVVPGGLVATAQAAATNPAGAATAVSSAVGAASPATGSAPAFSGAFDGTILFGAAVSLTGSTASEGKLTQDGYELWKETYNSAGGIMVAGKRYKIETKYYDDESNGPKSATLATQLIKQDKIQFLLGPYGTTSTLQVSTVAEQNKIPMIEGNGAAESIFNQGYTYTFAVLSPAKNYLAGCIDLALSQSPKPTTCAILTADDAFSVEVADAAKSYAEKQGFQVVYYQKYPNASTDLRAVLTETKGKNPDFFLNSGHKAEAVAIMQQAKELGFNPKGYAFSVGPSIPDFQTTLRADAEYVLGGTQWTPALKYPGTDLFKTPSAYNEVYKARFGYEPAYQSADGTACGVAFAKAIEAAGTLDPAKVRDAIAKLDFMTFYGQIKFDERGINTFKPMAVEQWQKGQKVTVFPQDVANGKAIWPTPAWNAR